MYATYNVAYGGVEPLRVREGDINLSHLLSALDCTGEANSHPSVLGLCIEFNRYSQRLVRAPFGKVSPSMSRIRDHTQHLRKSQAFAMSRNLGNGQVQKLTFCGPVVGVCNHSWIDSARICQIGLWSI